MENDQIKLTEVSTLASLFRERLARTPDKIAYRQFDIARQQWTESSWREMANEVARWQAGFKKDGLNPGDKVAVMLRNSREWVVFDQAATGLGLITVPLYVDDRPENVAYMTYDNQRLMIQEVSGPRWVRFDSLTEMEKKLAEDPRFFRCHRSYIVNLYAIREIRKEGGKNYVAAFANDEIGFADVAYSKLTETKKLLGID